ncbi:hypothetical protein [Flavihumibacter sp. CACIAM 22H1]|uniref:hypothetical protein n=1 Tax=Flavihumibacter sp. CACIAM 22H1 TaxID=1812911 RepID=UPI0007A82B6A|nr:hypothetical protein [Flavihumibacter sp. CACIAM 22H1]KYP15329.1 MAG: hypothetical protein A1D16_15615 [Flavihumibacter sp. CACIAM 22H1]
MNWYVKIWVSCFLLVLLTGMELLAGTRNNSLIRASAAAEMLQSNRHQAHYSDYLWINAPLPEKQEELLFVEETEDNQHNWVLLKSNRLFYTCISLLFGQPDPASQQTVSPPAAVYQPIQLSTIGRLSHLQIFRI